MEKFARKACEKLHKFSLIWNIVCDLLELVIASIVTVALVVSIISLLPGLASLMESGVAYTQFTEYLGKIFSCVVGIEFLKMLCHANSDNILETLIFLVARHMIIESSTSPIDTLVSVLTIILLVFARRFLAADRMKSHEKKMAEKNAPAEGAPANDFSLKSYVKDKLSRNNMEE